MKLEYVRRYQLDLQESYYRRRGAQHAANGRKAERLRVIGGLVVGALFVLAIAILLAPLSEDRPMWSSAQSLASLLIEYVEVSFVDILLLLLGFLMAVLFGVVYARSLIDNARRNAARFRVTVERLAQLRAAQLEEARKAALAPGRKAEVASFVARLHDIMATEHREWVELQKIEAESAASSLQGITAKIFDSGIPFTAFA